MTTHTTEGNMSSNHTIATTILAQLGGRVGAMLGAKHIINHGDGVSFRWPNRQRSKGNYLKVTLKGDDTYRMEFLNVAKYDAKPVRTFDGIFADQMIPTFEGQTGWALTL